MRELFSVKCSTDIAKALGAFRRRVLDRPYSFKVYEEVRTHHADLVTEDGRYVWLWKMDGGHRTIERLER